MSTFTRSIFAPLAACLAALSIGQGVPSAPHLTVAEKSAFLLMNPQVRTEVKLSSAQQAAVVKAISNYSTSQEKLFASKNPLDKEIKAVDISFAKNALAVVDNAQEKKLLALTIKQVGVTALSDKGIAARIGLTRAQSAKVAVGISKISRRKLAFDEMLAKGLAHIPGDNDAEKSANRTAVLKSYDSERIKLKSDLKSLEASVVASLTAPQRAKWQALQS